MTTDAPDLPESAKRAGGWLAAVIRYALVTALAGLGGELIGSADADRMAERVRWQEQTSRPPAVLVHQLAEVIAELQRQLSEANARQCPREEERG